MELGEPSLESVYFVVKNIDMWGGDVFVQPGYKGEDEAISAAKARIRCNDNYCATIFKDKDNNYTLTVKAKVLTNPSNNKGNWSNYKSIFYGKRYINPKSEKREESSTVKGKRIEPFLVQGLDMPGFDLEIKTMDSYDQAYQYIIQTIGDETSMCGMISDEWKINKYNAFIKDPRRCNPSQTKEGHWRFTSIFLGYEV